MVPISPVTNHDAHLGLLFGFVYIKVAKIANVSAI
jgi:hypothetical protein